ncbi:MAG: cellulase family glycosylhydrolase [Anaerolineae bacterium]
MSQILSGKGVWAVEAEHVAQAVQQAPLMSVTHILAKVGDTPMFDDGVRRTVYYNHAASACQQISAAGLVPMAWIFMRLLYPEEEAQLILRAFADGYQGVILNVEDPCHGMHDAAQQLVDHALTHGVDPHRVYNCSFPNISDHSGLPYETLNALCQGGLMPMAYAIFYFSDTEVAPAVQAQTVIDDWTYAQYESFYGALSFKPPMYPVLGPFHEQPELRLLTPAEFQPWLDRLAAHEPTFFSLYAIHTIDPSLYPMIRDFQLSEVGGEVPVIIQEPRPRNPEHYGINLAPDPPSQDPSHWPRHPHRLPTAEELEGVGWVRFVFKDSAVPDLTLEESFAHYGDIVDTYRATGIKTLLILNWESFWGHGPWDHGDWPRYTRDFTDYVRGVAQRFRGRVAAYQIWNEGDNPHGLSTSIFVRPESYAPILLQAGRAIKEVDDEALVVFGGVCRGAQDNVDYIQATRAAMEAWPVDAVGMHPYGQYPRDMQEFPHLTKFGELHNYLSVATQGLPEIPIWITEIGVPIEDPSLADDSSHHWEEIAEYLRAVYAEVEQHFQEQVPVVFWFGWSNKMKGSGIVDTHDNPKEPIYNAFFETIRGVV